MRSIDLLIAMGTDEIKQDAITDLTRKLRIIGFEATYEETPEGIVLKIKKAEPEPKSSIIY